VFCIRDHTKSKKAQKKEAKDAAKTARKEDRKALNVCFIFSSANINSGIFWK
jgi:hypothetical protein